MFVITSFVFANLGLSYEDVKHGEKWKTAEFKISPTLYVIWKIIKAQMFR